MGRRKKIDLLEKEEPSRSLPNYEFEKRKWDAYNDLREGASYRKAASQHNISYRCLFDYARGKRNRVESHERYMALPVELETELSNQILTLINQSGVFPQQKVISHLANALIKQNQEAQEAASAAAGSSSAATSPTSSSAAVPAVSSANAAAGPISPPHKPKPAVSDTWVSKFLRRHPELNYEKRTKRRKSDGNPKSPPLASNLPGPSGVHAGSPPMLQQHHQLPLPNIAPYPQALRPVTSSSSSMPTTLPPIGASYIQATASQQQQQQQQQQQFSMPLPPLQVSTTYPQQRSGQQTYGSSNNSNYHNYYYSQGIAHSPTQSLSHYPSSSSIGPSASSGSQSQHAQTHPPQHQQPQQPQQLSQPLSPSQQRSDLQLWFNGLNRIIDSQSIRPGNIYNATLLSFMVDAQSCTMVRNKRFGQQSRSGTLSSSYAVTIYECICTDGTALDSVLAGDPSGGTTPLPSGMRALSGLDHHAYANSTAASLEFFQWLKQHFDVATRGMSGGNWRLLITEESGSIDLVSFLWAFQHKILLVIVPSHAAHAVQPIERGRVLALLSRGVETGLATAPGARNQQNAFQGQARRAPSEPQSPLGADGQTGGSGRSPASTSPQLQNLVVNHQSGSSSSHHENGGEARPIAEFSLFLASYGASHLHSFTAEHIIDGWKRTGILPRNPNLVIDSFAEFVGRPREETLVGVVSAGSTTAGSDGGSVIDQQLEGLVDATFPSVSLMEAGIDIMCNGLLSAEDRAARLFELLRRSFRSGIDGDLTRRVAGSKRGPQNEEEEGRPVKMQRSSESVPSNDEEIKNDEEQQQLSPVEGESRPTTSAEDNDDEDEQTSSRRREEQLLLPELSIELASKIRQYLRPSQAVDESFVTIEQVVTSLLRFRELTV